MTKHSIRVFSDTIRRELSKDKVQVITLEPTFYQTNIINQTGLNNVRDRILSESPEDIKAHFLDVDGYVVFGKNQGFVAKGARENIGEVVDAMGDAVIRLHTKPYYRCCGYVDLGIWGVSHAPEVLLDLGLDLLYHNRFVQSLLRVFLRLKMSGK